MTLKVAIVDDNSFLIHAIKEKLSFFEDVAVKHTSLNGSELLAKLEENHNLDIILMDIEMPEMDGLEATRVIRTGKEKVRNPQIPIVALTAHALKDYEDKSYNAGMNNYLTKPVDIEQLSIVLQSL